MKRFVPHRLKLLYRDRPHPGYLLASSTRLLSSYLTEISYRLRTGVIDLQRTLMAGEDQFDAGRWAEMTDHLERASMPLARSPHVAFLEQYRRMGEAIFRPDILESTAYFENAVLCVRLAGHYFGQRTREGLRAQARAFAQLHDRVRDGNPSEVVFPSATGHSPRQVAPIVRRTLTAGTTQIVNGQHRLAVEWALGHRTARACILPPAATELQGLVLRVLQTKQRRELYQPIDRLDFDDSWTVVRRCEDRLALMLNLLAERGLQSGSMVDLACSFGWFVAEFQRRGYEAAGVEVDPVALRIGRIAYGLRPDRLFRSDISAFLEETNRRYDIVLLLSVLHHFAMKPEFGDPIELLQRVDKATGSVLFLDCGQAHEEWFSELLAGWDEGFIIDLIKRHTSFRVVVPLGVDSDNHRGVYSKNYRRMLFACTRD